jgi:hypothetical protein
VDFGNLDWLSQQNGGQFDPQLFGDYREPQNNILANATFDDSFFNDAFDVDFTTPFNTAPAQAQAQHANSSQKKKNLIEEIDARNEMGDDVSPINVNGKLLTCNNIWYVVAPHLGTHNNCPNNHTGRNCRLARRCRMVTLILMAFALICKRKPSAVVQELLWRRTTSSPS